MFRAQAGGAILLNTLIYRSGVIKSSEYSQNSVNAVKKGNNQYDLVIVGGGIVGAATAYEISRNARDLNILLVEKEKHLAFHQSGRNSGVIHSGIYYKPGSLKAKLCVAGLDLMYEFCDKYGVDYKRVGKLVVAVDESEVPTLRKLFENGKKNGVRGLELIGKEKMKELEPHCSGVEAINSPWTGIVDYGAVTRKLGEVFENNGGKIETDCEVTNFKLRADSDNSDYPLQIESNKRVIETKAVIVCAGLHADRVAALSGGSGEPKIVPFRGDYLVLKPEKEYLVKGNIYPVPDTRFPFLGVHFTPRMDGKVWLGPSAVFSFDREGYKFSNFNFRDFKESLTFSGFWKLATKYTSFGISEMFRAAYVPAQVKKLQRYIPELRPEDVERGPSGVRALALAPDGSLVEDFVVEPGSGEMAKYVMNVRNAPSPAATSSLAIAKYIRQCAEEQLEILKSENVKK